ncbi:MAG: lytic transglycosylase domain-containing protein [Campylobacterota bacterium]|nr:lytic transglycosylase domain-containing protein [Campylobacterota bacterium]
MIRLLVLCALAFSVNAITLEEINSKPPSRAKNFMIWQFMKQNITHKEAEEAFYQIKNVSINDLYTYAYKGDDKAIKYTTKCLSTKPKNLLILKDMNCLNLALTPYKYQQLTRSEKKELLKRVTDKKKLPWMKAMKNSRVSDTLCAATLLEIFMRGGKKYRNANFNRPYTPKELHNLSKEWRFDKFIAYSVLFPELDRIRKSLLHVKIKDVKNPKSHFYLALNAIKAGKEDIALQHLDIAYVKFYFQADKDKALFWKYQITHNKKILNTLSSSFDINIYTLFAREKLQEPLGNYYASLNYHKSVQKEDITDPFVWLKILDEVKATPQERLDALSKYYRNENMQGVSSFIYERATKYHHQGFIMPYREYVKELPLDTQAIIYSLMRQESRFIPSALSHAYAMGLMQIMPFLARDMEKKMPTKLTSLEDMFKPETNLQYAKKHLKWLQKSFYHPLLIAYSYNGGYGFTRRHVKSKAFSQAKYEPFLSMEMMSNSESREYGKKVLANYVVYKEILGEKISIIDLFNRLKKPSDIHRF